MRKLFSAAALVVILAGCASEKVLQATGGSRADGTVKMSYEVGVFEKPQINWEQSQETATARCKAWGYQNAERFDREEKQCQDEDCLWSFVTVEYQCIGENPRKQ